MNSLRGPKKASLSTNGKVNCMAGKLYDPKKTKRVDLGSAGSYTSHPGRLHKELGISQGGKIGVTRERAALKSTNQQTRRDARAALGYAAMRKGGK